MIDLVPWYHSISRSHDPVINFVGHSNAKTIFLEIIPKEYDYLTALVDEWASRYKSLDLDRFLLMKLGNTLNHNHLDVLAKLELFVLCKKRKIKIVPIDSEEYFANRMNPALKFAIGLLLAYDGVREKHMVKTIRESYDPKEDAIVISGLHHFVPLYDGLRNSEIAVRPRPELLSSRTTMDKLRIMFNELCEGIYRINVIQSETDLRQYQELLDRVYGDVLLHKDPDEIQKAKDRIHEHINEMHYKGFRLIKGGKHTPEPKI